MIFFARYSSFFASGRFYLVRLFTGIVPRSNATGKRSKASDRKRPPPLDRVCRLNGHRRASGRSSAGPRLRARAHFPAKPSTTAFGVFAEDCRFELTGEDEPFARELTLFEEPDGDVIAWDMETDALASYYGAFCLGAAVLVNPATIVLGAQLHIFGSTWTWFRTGPRASSSWIGCGLGIGFPTSRASPSHPH